MTNYAKSIPAVLYDPRGSLSITPGDVIWIEVKNQTATGYIFGNDGKIANFFRII